MSVVLGFEFRQLGLSPMTEDEMCRDLSQCPSVPRRNQGLVFCCKRALRCVWVPKDRSESEAGLLPDWQVGFLHWGTAALGGWGIPPKLGYLASLACQPLPFAGTKNMPSDMAKCPWSGGSFTLLKTTAVGVQRWELCSCPQVSPPPTG